MDPRYRLVHQPHWHRCVLCDREVFATSEVGQACCHGAPDVAVVCLGSWPAAALADCRGICFAIRSRPVATASIGVVCNALPGARSHTARCLGWTVGSKWMRAAHAHRSITRPALPIDGLVCRTCHRQRQNHVCARGRTAIRYQHNPRSNTSRPGVVSPRWRR